MALKTSRMTISNYYELEKVCTNFHMFSEWILFCIIFGIWVGFLHFHFQTCSAVWRGLSGYPIPGWYVQVSLLFQGSDLTIVMFKQHPWEWPFPPCLSLGWVGNRLSALRHALCSALPDFVQVSSMHRHTQELSSCGDKLDMAYNRTCPVALVGGIFHDKL